MPAASVVLGRVGQARDVDAATGVSLMVIVNGWATAVPDTVL